MEVGNKNHKKGSSAGRVADNIQSTNRNYGNYTIVESSESNLKYPASIWRFQKPHPSVAIHPTEKPVDLLRYAIRTYTNQNDVVLDNCCGSGSTLIAAKLEGRRYIGIDNGYCDRCGYTVEQAYSPVYEAFYDIKRGFKDVSGRYHSKNVKRHKRIRRKLNIKNIKVNPDWIFYI